MPYVSKAIRKELFQERNAVTPGELNFLFTDLIVTYIKVNGKSYQTINDVIGALEGAKLEFVRRTVNSYEQEKLEANGDVYA